MNMPQETFNNSRSPVQSDDFDAVWIDVGAHLGEKTFSHAEANPRLLVYAFEPLPQMVAQIAGRLPNYVVFQKAVCQTDGQADFYVNDFDAASSLLSFDAAGLRQWKGGEVLKVNHSMTVPTVRLDTFMDQHGIHQVEFLKIDAQGADLAVIRSAGRRIRHFRRINLEVQITPRQLYQGASGKNALTAYMTSAGFDLEAVQRQSFDQEENLTFIRRD